MLQGCLLSVERVLDQTHPTPQLTMTRIQSTDQILQSYGERIIAYSLWLAITSTIGIDIDIDTTLKHLCLRLICLLQQLEAESRALRQLVDRDKNIALDFLRHLKKNLLVLRARLIH